MRKRFLICLTIFVGVAAALVIGCWFVQPHPRIDRETFDKIEPGMTEREVEAIIGAPAGDYGIGKSWCLLDSTSIWGIAPLPIEKQWRAQECAIVLSFDSDSKVVGKTFSDSVIREYDSHFDMICCWLHLKQPRSTLYSPYLKVE